MATLMLADSSYLRVLYDPKHPKYRSAQAVANIYGGALYIDARLDFVDCCIMAISERLNITKVCTFDRRDFNIFRPKHCHNLEILP